MIIKNFIADLGKIYFSLKLSLKLFYQNSNFYDKKISKTKDIAFDYKPSPYLLSSIIKYQKKKYKIKELKKIKEQEKLNFDIEIDGGINFDNCKSAIEAGANILVSGTTVFKSNDGDIKKNINLLKLK